MRRGRWRSRHCQRRAGAAHGGAARRCGSWRGPRRRFWRRAWRCPCRCRRASAPGAGARPRRRPRGLVARASRAGALEPLGDLRLTLRAAALGRHRGRGRGRREGRRGGHPSIPDSLSDEPNASGGASSRVGRRWLTADATVSAKMFDDVARARASLRRRGLCARAGVRQWHGASHFKAEASRDSRVQKHACEGLGVSNSRNHGLFALHPESPRNAMIVNTPAQQRHYFLDESRGPERVGATGGTRDFGAQTRAPNARRATCPPCASSRRSTPPSRFRHAATFAFPSGVTQF